MDLPVFSLAEHDLEPGLVPLVAEHVCFGRTRPLTVHFDAFLPPESVCLGHPAHDLRHVHLRRCCAWMEERHREFSIVREEESAARVKIQPTYGHHAGADV
jgi:hypothetical protein